MAGRETDDDCKYFVHQNNGLLMYRKSGGNAVTPESENELLIVVPRQLRNDLLRWAHDDVTAGHLNDKKSLDRLLQHFTWPGVRRDVQLYCRGCGACQRLGKGAEKNAEPLKPLPVVGKPFDLIAADV